jgi:GAF domain-containing protein
MTSDVSYLAMLLGSVGGSPSPQDVVDVLVPDAADVALMFVRERDEFRIVASKHIDPDQQPVLDELAQVHHPHVDHKADPVANVVRTGTSVLSTWVSKEQVERITTDRRVHEAFDKVQPRNIVIVPLEREGVRYGAIVVALSVSGRRFIEGDLEFMREFAASVGPAMQLP